MSSKSNAVEGIIDNLRRIFQVVHEQSKISERETGLTGPQQWAMKIIAETAPVMVSDLARRLYLHPATVGGILDRIETKGLITRTRSEEDRRVVYVDLTEQGGSFLRDSPEAMQRLLEAQLEQLCPEVIDDIVRALEKLVKVLDPSEKTAETGSATEGCENHF